MEKRGFKKPCIFAANHETYYDGPALFIYLRFILRVKLGYLTREDIVENNFIWRFFLKRINHVAIPKDNPERSVKDSARIAQKGISIVVFPEGTTLGKKEGNLLKGKTGAIRMALAAGNIPIIPVGILYWGKRRPFKLVRKICFGEPFYAKPFRNYEELRNQTDGLMRAVAKVSRRKYEA